MLSTRLVVLCAPSRPFQMPLAQNIRSLSVATTLYHRRCRYSWHSHPVSVSRVTGNAYFEPKVLGTILEERINFNLIRPRTQWALSVDPSLIGIVPGIRVFSAFFNHEIVSSYQSYAHSIRHIACILCPDNLLLLGFLAHYRSSCSYWTTHTCHHFLQ